MELSDEEIKAIEKVKEAIRVDKEQRIVTIYDEKPLFRDQLQTLIDLIDKQQNQIERLKKDKEILYGVIDELKEDNDGDHIPRID